MKNDKKRKLLIIGIDGGTFKVIDPLIEAGKLPCLEKLIKSGVKGILKSTYPPITAAAWVSFMTGKNPGKHGFFDFRQYDPSKYELLNSPLIKNAVKEDISTLHSARFQGQTIWDFLTNAGYEINVVAVPMTYPPWKVNGRMVSGYPSPDYSKPKTYPPEWSDEIGQIFNMSAIDYSKISGFIRECKELIKRKEKIILDQLKGKKGKVFSVVFSSSDFAQHYFWKFLELKDHPYSSIIGEIYQDIDKVIGKMLDSMDEETSVFIVSDHGFTDYPKKKFHLNSWLAQEKYISLKQSNTSSGKKDSASILDAFLNLLRYKKTKWRWIIKEIISKMPLSLQLWASQQYFKSNLMEWKSTRAYRFKMYGPVEGVVINQEGRQEKGIVKEGEEYEKLRTEIMNELLNVKDPDTGEHVVDAVHRREEIFRGKFLNNAPDIIIKYTSNYYGGLEVSGPVISPVGEEETNESGIHDLEGILILCSPNVKKGIEIEPVNIIDVVPTILYDLNLPILKDIDGKIIEEAFLDSYRINSPIYVSVEEDVKIHERLSEEEEESMKKALKGLGYIE